MIEEKGGILSAQENSLWSLLLSLMLEWLLWYVTQSFLKHLAENLNFRVHKCAMKWYMDVEPYLGTGICGWVHFSVQPGDNMVLVDLNMFYWVLVLAAGH